MNNPISPEQARDVLREMLGGVMTNHYGLDKDAIVFINERVLTEYANALITKYFGEPVGQVGDMGRGFNLPIGTPLYARKE